VERTEVISILFYCVFVFSVFINIPKKIPQNSSFQHLYLSLMQNGAAAFCENTTQLYINKSAINIISGRCQATLIAGKKYLAYTDESVKS
jgi:hypothetical protein